MAVVVKGEQPKTIFFPHCTWDKFGEILANVGGISFGLFDELAAFFSTMNMYSSVKMEISDQKISRLPSNVHRKIKDKRNK